MLSKAFAVITNVIGHDRPRSGKRFTIRSAWRKLFMFIGQDNLGGQKSKDKGLFSARFSECKLYCNNGTPLEQWRSRNRLCYRSYILRTENIRSMSMYLTLQINQRMRLVLSYHFSLCLVKHRLDKAGRACFYETEDTASS